MDATTPSLARGGGTIIFRHPAMLSGWDKTARVYLELEDSTGSLSGTMIGDTAEKFLQYTGQQLMDSGSQVLEKIRITLEEAQFFYVKGMKKNVLDNEYKYDIIFLNESVPSMTSSTSQDQGVTKGKM
ncbi:hypothetical protein Fot_28580 [Forsythia ovata]|uniref:Uncharacterized protein n=1 Tax=Forsythia ovata TaxID=205694 RepID=A0ABD1S1E7_9LAMI